jgi:hypothetical protein
MIAHETTCSDICSLLRKMHFFHQKIIYGTDAIAYSTGTKYLCLRQFTSILIDRREEPAPIVIDQGILDVLGQYPFSSIRDLARLTCIPTPTIYRHLTQSLGFVVKYLRWVPHTLAPTQKMEHATLSIELLCQLRSIEHHGWQFIIARDQSWFYLPQTMIRSGFA